ncbi:MAG: hypothetical protein WKG03_09095 [Telluria sp.]
MHKPTPQSTPRAIPALHLFTLAILLLAGGAAHAGDDDAYPVWSFSGFGSLGVAHSDYDQADFTSNILKDGGAGASHKWASNLDSRLGGQLGVKFHKHWSGVVQIGVEQRYDGSYRPQVEWANVKYQATPKLALRVGRIALPIFLAADYRKIGYAYPWVRTPNEVYGGVPITNSDGADIAYRWQSGRVKHTTQAFYGKTDVYLTKTTGVKARGLGGVTHSAEWGPATVRVSAFTAVLDVNIVRALFDGYRQFGPAGVAIADKYDVVARRTTGFAMGVNYDPGKWFLMAEGGRMNTRSFLGDTIGMYASAGYRIGEFTPYLSYSRNKAMGPLSDPGLSLAGLPPPVAYAAAQLNGNLNVLLKATSSQTNIGVGVRWDLRPDMALKLQYEHLTPRDGTRGTLINLQSGFVSGHSVNVTSAVLDFVF